MKRPRRLIMMIALLLLGGMAINVGVTWGRVFWMGQFGGDIPAPYRVLVEKHSTVVAYGLASEKPIWIGFVQSPVLTTGMLRADAGPTFVRRTTLPFRELKAIANEAPITKPFRVIHASGWPMLAFWTDVGFKFKSRTITRRSGKGRSIITFNWPLRELDAYPLRPIWPGFAINTLFYTIILALPWLGFVYVRHVRRTRRGACLTCGYDNSATPIGNVCPECGSERPLSPALSLRERE